MQPSQTLDDKASRRALSIVAADLRKSGANRLLSQAMVEAQPFVRLPEVHLFTAGGDQAPVTWLLPTFKGDESTLILAYEALVAQSLGTTPYPGKVAEQVLNEGCGGYCRRSLDTSSNPRHWFTPAVRLVALAQTVTGFEVNVDLESHTFTARIDGAYLHVAPDRVFSNTLGEFVTPTLSPLDVALAHGLLPQVTTASKLFVAVASMLRGVDRDALLALRGVYAALEGSLTTEFEVRERLEPRPRIAAKKLPAGVALADLQQQAADEALGLIAEGGDDLVRRLYTVVVPSLFSAREFVRLFGSTSTSKDRSIRPTTLTHWATRVKERLTEGI